MVTAVTENAWCGRCGAFQLNARQKGHSQSKTTQSNHHQPFAPNLLLERPPPTRHNEIWVTDITYVRTVDGWCYLSATLDLCTRKVIAWNLGENLGNKPCSTTLSAALEKARPQTNSLIHHSDRGVQYASQEFRAILKLKGGITQRMSRRGNCYGNAAMESFWATYKCECLQSLKEQKTIPTKEKFTSLTFEFMEIIYNKQQLHSSLDYKTPNEYHEILLNQNHTPSHNIKN